MSFVNSILEMLGRTPGTKPPDSSYSDDAREIHERKRDIQGKKERADAIRAERDLKRSHKWRNRRWASILIVNGLFVLSFQVDVQLIEGSLSASRVE